MWCRGWHWRGFVSHREETVEGNSTVEVLLSELNDLSPTVCSLNNGVASMFPTADLREK